MWTRQRTQSLGPASSHNKGRPTFTDPFADKQFMYTTSPYDHTDGEQVHSPPPAYEPVRRSSAGHTPATALKVKKLPGADDSSSDLSDREEDVFRFQAGRTEPPPQRSFPEPSRPTRRPVEDIPSVPSIGSIDRTHFAYGGFYDAQGRPSPSGYVPPRGMHTVGAGASTSNLVTVACGFPVEAALPVHTTTHAYAQAYPTAHHSHHGASSHRHPSSHHTSSRDRAYTSARYVEPTRPHASSSRHDYDRGHGRDHSRTRTHSSAHRDHAPPRKERSNALGLVVRPPSPPRRVHPDIAQYNAPARPHAHYPAPAPVVPRVEDYRDSAAWLRPREQRRRGPRPRSNSFGGFNAAAPMRGY